MRREQKTGKGKGEEKKKRKKGGEKRIKGKGEKVILFGYLNPTHTFTTQALNVLIDKHSIKVVSWPDNALELFGAKKYSGLEDSIHHDL